MAAVLAVAVTIATVVSFRFGVFRGHWASGEYTVWALERGSVTFNRSGPSLMIRGGEVHWQAFNAWANRVTLQSDPMGLRGWAPWVSLWSGRSGHQRRVGSFPLWMPAAGLAVTAWGLRGSRRGAGCCPACGYPRQGLAVAVPCPECGELLS